MHSVLVDITVFAFGKMKETIRIIFRHKSMYLHVLSHHGDVLVLLLCLGTHKSLYQRHAAVVVAPVRHWRQPPLKNSSISELEHQLNY